MDWTDIFKEKLLAEGPPLPEDDWAVVDSLVRRRGRRKAMVWFAGVSAAAAAAVLLALPFVREEVPAVGTDAVAVVETVPSPASSLVPEPVGRTEDPVVRQAHQPALRHARPDRASQDEENPEAETTSQVPPPAPEPVEGPVVRQAHQPEQQSGKVTATQAHQPVEEMDQPEEENYWKEADFTEQGATPSADRFMTSIYSGDSASGLMDFGSGLKDMETEAGEGVSVYDHGMHANFGLSLSYRISENLYLTSGLDYSLCLSTVHFKDKTSASQKAHYLGVPVHLDWAPVQGRRFSFYTGLGGEVRKCIYATLDGNKLKDNTIYPSFICLAGLRFEPVDRFGIFLEPQYSRTLLPDNPPVVTSFTESRDLLSVKVGLSFRWR